MKKGIKKEYIVENIKTGEKKTIISLRAVADFLGKSYGTVEYRYRKKLPVNGCWIYLPKTTNETSNDVQNVKKPWTFKAQKRNPGESPLRYLSRVQTTMSTKAIAEELGVSTVEVERMFDWLLKYKRLGGKVRDLDVVRKAADAVEVLSKLQSRKILESH